MSAKQAVMVVEDEAHIATMLRYNLEKQGYRVAEASDGQEALTRIQEQQPDIVLLDWMLPLMSGIEVCRQIRRRPSTRDLPVIMVTARTEDQEERHDPSKRKVKWVILQGRAEQAPFPRGNAKR